VITRLRLSAVGVAGSLFLVVACSTTTYVTSPGDGTDPDPDGGATATAEGGGGGDGEGVASGDACSRYVACTVEVAPESAVEAMTAYGPEGACFASFDRATCLRGCQKALEGLHAIHGSVAACALCASDADCGGATPACAGGACVACADGSHCAAPEGVCNTSEHRCVQCTSDADCSGAMKGCLRATGRCAQCTSDTHCASGRCGDDQTCCVPVSPCTPGACGTKTDNCGRQVQCGGCAAGSYCDTGGGCRAITPTYDCYSNGSGDTCTKKYEYCYTYVNGPGTYSSCKYIPTECTATPTCACLRAQGTIFAKETCSEGTGGNGFGAVYVSYNPLL